MAKSLAPINVKFKCPSKKKPHFAPLWGYAADKEGPAAPTGAFSPGASGPWTLGETPTFINDERREWFGRKMGEFHEKSRPSFLYWDTRRL